MGSVQVQRVAQGQEPTQGAWEPARARPQLLRVEPQPLMSPGIILTAHICVLTIAPGDTSDGR